MVESGRKPLKATKDAKISCKGFSQYCFGYSDITFIYYHEKGKNSNKRALCKVTGSLEQRNENMTRMRRKSYVSPRNALPHASLKVSENLHV